MTGIYVFVLIAVCIAFGYCAVSENNQEADQIKLFNDENDINELIGFPDEFFEKHGKQSPFIVLSTSPSNEFFNSDVLEILENEEKMDNIFFCFKEEFGKSYEQTQEAERKSILQEKIQYTLKHNMEARKGKQEYTLGINEFSDLTFEEFSMRMLRPFEEVNVIKAKTDLNRSEPFTKRIRNRNARSHINWSEFDTPVKDQGQCGSSWAFATTAVIENHLKKNNYTKEIDLSEQELVDCCNQCHANIHDRCNGSRGLDSPFEYARDRFISHENFYEYKAKGGQCQRQWELDDKIANILMTNFTCAKLGEDAMRHTIAIVGAVATVVFVNSDFMSYKKGIFGECCKGTVNHAVSISGYRYDMSSGKNYWIIKNSWGTSWGEKGYIKIAMGNKRCGIGTYDSCYPHITPRKDPKNDYEKSLTELKSEFLYSLNNFKFELKKTEDRLTETKEENADLDGRLKKVEETRNEIFNVAFNKDVSHYKLFTDPNGKKKAFLIPVSAMKHLQYTFEDSVNLCKNFNSTLIEIESLEKQIILETFLRQLGLDFSTFSKNKFPWFWINAKKDSSGKWKWLKSDKEFTYTNWYNDNSGHDNIIVMTTFFDSGYETFGKWVNYQDMANHHNAHVICEHTFEF